MGLKFSTTKKDEDPESYSTPPRSANTHNRTQSSHQYKQNPAPHVITPPPIDHICIDQQSVNVGGGSRVMELEVRTAAEGTTAEHYYLSEPQKDEEEEEEDSTLGLDEEITLADEDDEVVSRTTTNNELTTMKEASFPPSAATVMDLPYLDEDDGAVPASIGNFEYKKSRLGGYLAYQAVDIDEEDEYVVDDLEKIRETESGSFEFLVKWAGYGRSTWEPRENLNSSLDDRVQELIDEYETGVSLASESTVGINKRKKKTSKGTSVASKRQKVSHKKKVSTKKSTKGTAKKTAAQGTARRASTKSGRGVFKNSPSKLAVQDSYHGALQQMDFVRDSVPMCFASQIFGQRLRKFSDVSLTTVVQPVEHRGQETMVLLCSKEQTDAAGFRQQRTQTLYYVVTEAPGVSKISVQDELDKFADFAAIPMRNKLASRLELLFTDAKKINTSKNSGYLLVEDLSPDDFEEIDEVDHIGCGFIPRAMIENLLGSGKTVENCSSIQVRILVPKFGLFKGMLQVKPGIQRIQLPSSMKKVGPSLVKDRHDLATMLVHNTFPSKRNKYIAKMLNGEPVPPSERENLQRGDGRKGTLSPMMKRVLQEASVDIGLINKYIENVREDVRALQHTTLIGLCDPTEGRAIPTGFVFLTGVVDPTGGGKHLLTAKSVVVSRFPCTSRYDQTTLKVLKEKPAAMTMADWDDLCRRKFGEIIFGKPKEGNVPIPETIASGDLDGDLYFVTWYAPFLQKTMKHKRNDRGRPGAEVAHVVRNDNWFEEAQAFLCDAGAQQNYSYIRGTLHSLWEKHVDTRNRDAEHFGEAFKRSLEIKKHGGKIYLPQPLWEKLKSSLHQFLTSDQSASNGDSAVIARS